MELWHTHAHLTSISGYGLIAHGELQGARTILASD
jgi:hypothetical protein